MNEYLHDAHEELKRVDHLIFVSLKYTRTVDVIKSIIVRLINCFDFCVLALLCKIKDVSEEDLPKSPGLRTNMLAEEYKNEEDMQEFLKFYHLLRSLSRAEFSRAREYRRHVTMTALLQEGPAEVNIDIITEYYRKTKIFTRLVSKMLNEDKSKLKELLRRSNAEIEFEGL